MKNLYGIMSLYVDDGTYPTTPFKYLYAENDEQVYEYVKEHLGFRIDDKTLVIENQGEIGLEDEDYDSYYNETIYGWEECKSNITLDEAKDFILQGILLEINE